MEYLLDTHTLVWYMLGADDLSKNAHDLILDKRNNLYVSVASLWEIAIKIVIGKLDEKAFNLQYFIKMCKECDIAILPVTSSNALSYKSLPLKENHRDPFDRMIISAAIENDFTLLSKDERFAQYKSDGLKLLW